MENSGASQTCPDEGSCLEFYVTPCHPSPRDAIKSCAEQQRQDTGIWSKVDRRLTDLTSLRRLSLCP